MFEMNPVLERLPQHLMDFVIEQPYNEYTAQDHAVWRYIMRQNVKYLSEVAHSSYLDGLKQTGISIEYIPHMYGMNRILKDIGWAAVAVDGFIPPAAFMEFQAYNVLVIAADMRPIDQIEYTPSPDIVHEAAGHAPIIANEEYSEYLWRFGELGAKAFSSKRDYDLYEAVRHLSILKADPYTKKEDIEQAEKDLEHIDRTMGEPSEMALIRNLHWWTVEYGLIGDLNKPKIYGAGLLSSIGESYNCLQPHVKKYPYTLDAMNYDFDITTQQPHLFVTPDFDHLNKVLDEFADTMALRRGGMDAVNKAIGSGAAGTLEWNSGLQVSGTFTDVIEQDGEPIFVKSTGPTALSYNDSQLPDHGKDNHADGFGSPIGRPMHFGKPLENITDGDLKEYGIERDKNVRLEFDSGVTVDGRLRDITRREGKLLLMHFDDCRVTYLDQTLFAPDWGVFDMAVGESIGSGYNGPADAKAWQLNFNPPEEKTHKIEHTETSKKMHRMYQTVRDIRENGKDLNELENIWKIIKSEYPEEWLLALEIYELLRDSESYIEITNEIKNYLSDLRDNRQEFSKLIDDGFALMEEKTVTA